MKRVTLVAACAAACLSLSACATANTDPAEVLRALGENYGHCERLVSYSASVGAFNPGSGATISGQVRCPPKAASTPAPAVDPVTPAGRNLTVSRFTDHLGLVLLEYSNGRPVLRGGRVLWRLSSPLTWEVGELGSGVLIIVPSFDPTGWTDEALRTIRFAGVTDLASIPPLARPLLPPDGPWAKAAVLHDQGYVSAGWYGAMSRKAVDDLLNEAMKALGVPAWKRALIYRTVRLFGASRWGT